LTVIATGGVAELFGERINGMDLYNDRLTLEGMARAWRIAKPPGEATWPLVNR
jgi:hypothetical protein